MNAAVTVIAQGDCFAHVGFVQSDGVLQNFSFIAVQFPESEQHVIQFDNVMTFEFFHAVALETARRFVSFYPVVVCLGCADLLFECTNL